MTKYKSRFNVWCCERVLWKKDTNSQTIEAAKRNTNKRREKTTKFQLEQPRKGAIAEERRGVFASGLSSSTRSPEKFPLCLTHDR
jgi:hypothetical protein